VRAKIRIPDSWLEVPGLFKTAFSISGSAPHRRRISTKPAITNSEARTSGLVKRSASVKNASLVGTEPIESVLARQ
jgi:hypothetical protein